MPVVITANRLSDGLVVFLGPREDWVGAIADALVLSADEARAALVKAKHDEALNLVVDPYAVEVTGEGATVKPSALREAIRARGPTVRPDLRGGGGAPARPPQQPAYPDGIDVSI